MMDLIQTKQHSWVLLLDYEHRRVERWTARATVEQQQHNHTTADPRSRPRSHARGLLGSVGLLVARCRAVERR